MVRSALNKISGAGSGLTEAQANAITLNTAKIGITPAEQNAITANQTSINTINTDMPHLSTFPTWESMFAFDGASRKFRPKHAVGDANKLHLKAYKHGNHNTDSTPQVTRLKAGKIGGTQVYEVVFRGAVQIDGISALKHDDTLFVMPVGYRPTTWRRIPVASSTDDTSALDFHDNGIVKLTAVESGQVDNHISIVSLEGVRFYTA